ncbi:MAG: hypothetical protein ACRDL5_07270 [Solirubrobacteraceae bacterium]
MLHDRDDYTLLMRAGRVPHEMRAGPSGRLRPGRAYTPAPDRRPVPRARRPALAGLRQLMRSPRGRRPQRLPATPPLDRQSYLELEFAVGFGVEDEQLR